MPDSYTIQRYRGVFAIVWHENGKRRRYSLGTTDRATADATARAVWHREQVGGEAKTVGAAVEAYLKAKADMSSINRAKTAWKAAKPFWNAMPIARVDEQAALDYRARRPHCKPITIRNELAVIRAALNWAKKAQLIKEAPFVKLPSFPASEVGHLSKQEFRKLVEGAVRPHVRLFMQLAVATGARTNALLDLQWSQVDFERGIITLNPRDRVQTSKYRATVPMNDQIKALLAEAKESALSDYVIEHGRGRVASIKKGFAAACGRAVVKATPHMLRHSAAVWMAEADVPIGQIAQYLGHTDSRITERVYARFRPSFLSGAAKALIW